MDQGIQFTLHWRRDRGIAPEILHLCEILVNFFLPLLRAQVSRRCFGLPLSAAFSTRATPDEPDAAADTKSQQRPTRTNRDQVNQPHRITCGFNFLELGHHSGGYRHQ